MKKMLFVLTIISLAFVFGCGNNEASTEAGTEEDKAGSGNKLVRGTSADYPPFEYHETSNGNDEIVGFDIDLAKAIAKEMGRELEIQDIGFSGLIPALQSKRVDIVLAGMNPTDERKQSVDFSDKYLTTEFAAVYMKEKPVTQFADLKGKKIGVQLGTTQEQAAKDAGLETVSLDKYPDLIQELKSGRIDAVLVEDTVAAESIGSDTALDYKIVPEIAGLDIAVALPKDSELTGEINEAIKTLIDKGEVDKLKDKWLKLK